MFDLLKDVARFAGSVIGTVTGSVIGLSAVVISEALGITVEMTKEALGAGCESYEDIKKYWRL